MVFQGKNKAFTTHVSAERTFIRGKREPCFEVEHYDSWNVDYLTVDYNNLIYTPIDSNILIIPSLELENKFQKKIKIHEAYIVELNLYDLKF